MNLRDFRIDIPAEDIEDLRRRLLATRLPSSLDATNGMTAQASLSCGGCSITG
jgi:hypothetical protein